MLPALTAILEHERVSGAVIVSAVASLRRATLRNITRFPEEWPITADCREVTKLAEPLEIISLQGNAACTVDGRMSLHLHVCLSRGHPPGSTFSGHLLEDSIVATTCELAIVEASGLTIRRELDAVTGAPELVIE